jgi:hypothetical protein
MSTNLANFTNGPLGEKARAHPTVDLKDRALDPVNFVGVQEAARVLFGFSVHLQF